MSSQKNLWSVAAIVSVFIVLLAGALASAEKVVVWTTSNNKMDVHYEFLINQAKMKDPSLDVELSVVATAQADFLQKLSIAIATGTAPDFAWMDSGLVKSWASQGLLTDISKAVADMNMAPSDLEEMSYKGKIYGAPLYIAVRGLVKRVDYLQNAGINPAQDPANIEELDQWNQKLTIKHPDGKYQQVGFLPWEGNWGGAGWIWAFGGELITETEKGFFPTADLPANIHAFNWLAEWGLRLGRVLRPFAGGYNRSYPYQLADGYVAMQAASTTQVSQQILPLNVPITTGRVPHVPGGRNGAWGGAQCVVIPVNATNKEGALRLLPHFISTEAQVTWYRNNKELLPANLDALFQIARDLPVAYGHLLDQVAELNARPPLWTEYNSALNSAMQQVVQGKAMPAQALSDVQAQMAAMYEEFNKSLKQ